MEQQRRNMTAGVLHGAFFQMATAFAEPLALLPVFFKIFTSSNVLVGVANLPLNRVIGETIPPDRRSSFFGLRLLCGGMLAMLAGYLVKPVMGRRKFVLLNILQKQIAEPIFGIIQPVLGCRKLPLRGWGRIEGGWILMASAGHMKRLFQVDLPLTGALSIPVYL